MKFTAFLQGLKGLLQYGTPISATSRVTEVPYQRFTKPRKDITQCFTELFQGLLSEKTTEIIVYDPYAKKWSEKDNWRITDEERQNRELTMQRYTMLLESFFEMAVTEAPNCKSATIYSTFPIDKAVRRKLKLNWQTPERKRSVNFNATGYRPLHGRKFIFIEEAEKSKLIKDVLLDRGFGVFKIEDKEITAIQQAFLTITEWTEQKE
uniref:DUF5591 domain-containing protein n=1 Tax=Steinernema glaseri TaxID=37863 RepID=A0A1I8A344_9BILA